MEHGGKRTGAGRPRVKLSRTKAPLKRITAEEILAEVDEKAEWFELLDAETVISVRVIGGENGERENVTVPDYRVRIDALKYLTNRRDGMPAQALKHSGPEGDDPVKVLLIGSKGEHAIQ